MVVLVFLFSWVFSSSTVTAYVSYDHRAIIVNGQKRVLISGSIHYPRSTPKMWPDLIQKAKDGGLDVIQTYVFWNGRELLLENIFLRKGMIANNIKNRSYVFGNMCSTGWNATKRKQKAT